MIALVQQKKCKISFGKANTKFCLRLLYSGDESYLYTSKAEISKYKANDNIGWYNFCLGSISKDFTKDKQSEIFLNGTADDFLIDIVQAFLTLTIF